MTRQVSVLCMLMLAACNRTEGAPTVPPQPSVVVEAPRDAAPPPVMDTSPETLAKLLAGELDASALPEQSTDPGRVFQTTLREKLGTIAVPDADADAPSGDVKVSEVTVKKDAIPTELASRRLMAARARMRACYANSLRNEPQKKGSLIVQIEANPKGSTASVVKNEGLSPELAACVQRQLTQIDFGERSASIRATLTFAPR